MFIVLFRLMCWEMFLLIKRKACLPRASDIDCVIPGLSQSSLLLKFANAH